MAKTAKESPLTFMSGNKTGRITSAAQVSKLRWEAKRNKQLDDGIHPTNNIDDCLKTMSNIVLKDISTRPDKRDDGNDVMKGIVRRCNFVPAVVGPNTPSIAPDIILHERALCAFLGELCERNNIVISLDSTGDMVNFQDTDFDGKVLHTMMMIQYRESVMSRDQNKNTHTKDFSSIRVSERISSWNTADAVCSWMKQLVSDVEIATKSVLGRKITPTIGMVRSDNALQFTTGSIMALRNDSQVDSARGYNNISLILLIQHERRTNSLANEGMGMDFKQSCMLVMSQLKQYSPLATTICNVHTYLYRRDGYKNMKNKPSSLKGYYQEINRLYSNVAHGFMREKSVSRLLCRMAILVAIFERNNIPCMNLGVNTWEWKGHSKSDATEMANKMHALVNEAISSLHHHINEKSEELISDELRQIGCPTQQRFRGSTVIAGDMLQMIIERLSFSLSYPVTVDKVKKEAVVRTLVMYSPYDFAMNGGWDIEVMPKLLGRFETVVSLPYRKGSIKNPLYSSELANYWRKEMNRAGLNSAAISPVAGAAWDRDLFDSNMSLEAYLKDMVHNNSRHKASIGSVPSFMMGRWEDSIETAALVSNQIKVHHVKRQRREDRAAARSLGSIREEDEEPGWQRDSRATVGPLKDRLKKMVTVLTEAMHQERTSEDARRYIFDRNNAASMYRVLEYASTKMDGSNLSQKDYYEWLRGQRRCMLPRDVDTLIDGMYDKYVHGSKQEKQKGRNTLKGSERQYRPQRILSPSFEDNCDYVVQWAPDGSTTHEPQSNIADTGVIDIYDWDIDAKEKLGRTDRCYPEIVTIRHQFGESMVDLGNEDVKWRRININKGNKRAQEQLSEGDTIYIIFKKAGNIEVGCEVVSFHEKKKQSKKKRRRM